MAFSRSEKIEGEEYSRKFLTKKRRTITRNHRVKKEGVYSRKRGLRIWCKGRREVIAWDREGEMFLLLITPSKKSIY